jgi:hypothetical protein
LLPVTLHLSLQFAPEYYFVPFSLKATVVVFVVVVVVVVHCPIYILLTQPAVFVSLLIGFHGVRFT